MQYTVVAVIISMTACKGKSSKFFSFQNNDLPMDQLMNQYNMMFNILVKTSILEFLEYFN